MEQIISPPRVTRTLKKQAPVAQKIVRLLIVTSDTHCYHEVHELLTRIDRRSYTASWSKPEDASIDALKSRPDLVLLHYPAASADNATLLQQFRNRKLPVVVMLGERQSLIKNTLLMGACDYLVESGITVELLDHSLRYALARHEANLKLISLAQQDPLTKLPNRVLFEDRLNNALLLAERDKTPLTLLYLDLNGFKRVNDFFGHAMGDRLLVACAARLRACLRKSDTIARMGGDEFTILLGQMDSASDVAHLCQKILDEIARPYRIEQQQITIGCCIGIALYPDGATRADDLLRHADMAMYEAKKSKRNRYCFYTKAMNRHADYQLHLAQDLRQGLENREFVLHYQPRHDARTGDVVSIAASLRWRHPVYGLIDADEFSRIAEKSGVMLALGHWMLERACRDWSYLNTCGFGHLRMSIRLSPRQFSDKQLFMQLDQIFKITGMSPANLEFELSEPLVANILDDIKVSMAAIAQRGIGLILNDFGSGLSSLARLQQLPITHLKIARELVAKLDGNTASHELIKSLIAFAHGIKRRVIVENQQAKIPVTRLAELECDELQSGDCSAAVDIEALDELLQRPAPVAKRSLG